MSNFNLNAFNSNSVSTDTSNNSLKLNPKFDENCFKESMTGIENYWKELLSDLDSKKKDVTELSRMYKTYRAEEYNYLIDTINYKINEIEDKLSFIQKVMWDIRSKIIFSK